MDQYITIAFKKKYLSSFIVAGQPSAQPAQQVLKVGLGCSVEGDGAGRALHVVDGLGLQERVHRQGIKVEFNAHVLVEPFVVDDQTYVLLVGLKTTVVGLLAPEVRRVRRGGPEHKVLFPQVPRVEKVGTEQGSVLYKKLYAKIRQFPSGFYGLGAECFDLQRPLKICGYGSKKKD